MMVMEMENYTQKDCIKAMKSASHFLGISFTRDAYDSWRSNRSGFPSPAQISRRCHGFNRAKELAGLIPNATIRTSNQFSNDELIRMLKRCYEDTGDRFSESAYEKWRKDQEGAPSIETIRNRLGSLIEVKKKLGMAYFEEGSETVYDSGRWKVPFMKFLTEQLNMESYEKWLRAHDGPSVPALYDHVGGYEKALIDALKLYVERIQEGRRRRR